MIYKKIAVYRKILLGFSILTIFSTQEISAQSWMAGYNYRKKITINKSQVSGNADLSDFPVLIELLDPDLMYISNTCDNKISGSRGLDISFATSLAPTVPISFELDEYDPLTGRLICWVKIGSLSAAGSASASNVLYFYYGSNAIHSPVSAVSMETWSGFSTRVWHLKSDRESGVVRNSGTNHTDEELKGIAGAGSLNFVEGKIGRGIRLNGSSDGLRSATPERNTQVTVSMWLKTNGLGQEQMIVSNDSAGINPTGGFSLKVDSSGFLKIELRRHSLPLLIYTGHKALNPGIWNYITATIGNAVNFYINGDKDISAGALNRFGPGGSIKIGIGRQNEGKLEGDIDEVGIQNTIRDSHWIKTVYNNQNDPFQFYSVDHEEQNAVQAVTGAVFDGAADENWDNASNWNLAEIPADNMNLIVKEGKHVRLNRDVIVNKLVVENGASLTAAEGTEVSVGCDVWNQGTIRAGKWTFSGLDLNQTIVGNGVIKADALDVNQSLETGNLQMNARFEVAKTMRVKKGIVQANSNLTFLSSPQNGTAALLPVAHTAGTTIAGEVVVQQYISGPFPAPGTARGWRLIGSPVYHSEENSVLKYHLFQLKDGLFVTGPGGAINGFDPSPNNGSTIYIHDQSLPGTISQKYKAIADMNATVTLGKGIYVFSRGGRNIADAYSKQVQNMPFINPEGYTINHKGYLFTGDLKVDVFNNNSGQAGDGFNLLANPYVAAIKWGELDRQNLSPFVWTYDPVNHAYRVTDDEDCVISCGSGFFVKVVAGQSAGSLTFREAAKHVEISGAPPVVNSLRGISATGRITDGTMHKRRLYKGLELAVTLSRAQFEQEYRLILNEEGSDEVNDADALKIGDGFVRIAGISPDGTWLSVDQRRREAGRKTVSLYTKGWGEGVYTLTIRNLDQMNKGDRVTLVDTYLNSMMPLTGKEIAYAFVMDPKIGPTEGGSRFQLVVETDESIQPGSSPGLDTTWAFPNPFKESLYLKTDGHGKPVRVCIRDMMGRLAWTGNLNPEGGISEIQVNTLVKGMCTLELVNSDGLKTKSIKIIKQ